VSEADLICLLLAGSQAIPPARMSHSRRADSAQPPVVFADGSCQTVAVDYCADNDALRIREPAGENSFLPYAFAPPQRYAFFVPAAFSEFSRYAAFTARNSRMIAIDTEMRHSQEAAAQEDTVGVRTTARVAVARCFTTQHVAVIRTARLREQTRRRRGMVKWHKSRGRGVAMARRRVRHAGLEKRRYAAEENEKMLTRHAMRSK